MLCRKHRIRHEYSQRLIAPVQDWVQLPTKVEMDIFREELKNENKFHCKQRVIVTSKTWEKETEKIGGEKE